MRLTSAKGSRRFLSPPAGRSWRRSGANRSLRGERGVVRQAAERKKRVRARLRELAIRALAGTPGTEAQELARHVAIDADGNVCDDDSALAKFGRTLAELGAI